MSIIENPTWTLRDRLRKARQLAGYEQNDMARLLGVGRTTVSQWETGKTEPSASNFVRWAHVTGQPLEFLAEGVQKAPSEDGAIVRPEGFEPPTFWSVAAGVIWLVFAARHWTGCPCREQEYHGRGDCAFGCSCGWCAPEISAVTR